MMALIFSIIYALIILFTGINEVLKFKNNDRRIIYNAVNMAIIFSVMMFIFKTLSYLKAKNPLVSIYILYNKQHGKETIFWYKIPV